MPMTDKKREDYERAAVALEMHEQMTPGSLLEYHEIALRAWGKCFHLELGREDADLIGARLLRDCIARNEVLK